MNNHLFNDNYVVIDNHKIRYWKEGNNKNTIILIHGLGSMIESWQENISFLSKTHTVYAIDLLGFGLSAKPNYNYTIPLLSQFLNSFCEHFSIETTILIGNSMGGSIALYFADMYPDKSEKIILISTAGLSKKIPLGLRLLTIPTLGEFLNKPSKFASKKMLETVYYNKQFINSDFINFSYEIAKQEGATHSFLSILRSMSDYKGTKLNFFNQIKSILSSSNIPTLVIWGENDKVLPLKHSSGLLKKFPMITTHIIKKCGHLPHMEYPEKFHNIIVDFIQGKNI